MRIILRFSIVSSSPECCGGSDCDCNVGDGNSGNDNSGDDNSGDGNSGDGNSGDDKTGDDNCGESGAGAGNEQGGNDDDSWGCDGVESEFESCDTVVASVSVEAMIEARRLARIA